MNLDSGIYAVITGAASGIGEALARECANSGVNTFLVDTNEKGLKRLQTELQEIGTSVEVFAIDVTNLEQVNIMAQDILGRSLEINYVFNNAGVLKVAPLLEHTAKDWDWVLGVNLIGAINVTNAFAPALLVQQTESHLIYTASLASFTSGPGLAAYKVSKHALLAFAEVLYYETQNTNIKVSVVCPGWVNTSIMHSEVNKPEKFVESSKNSSIETRKHWEAGVASAANGQDPVSLAKNIFAAIENKQFYIIPDSSFEARFKKRNSYVLKRENPVW